MLQKEKMFKDLSEKGWFFQESVLEPEFLQEVSKELENRKFKSATVGENKNLQVDIRNDKICWLEKDDASDTVQKYFSIIDDLKKSLKEYFFLSIKDFEVHFAEYEPGGFYKPHYDNFKGKNKRVITFITYLNEHWKQDDGGTLKIHSDGDGTSIELEPKSGSVVIFLSDKILHEVTQSHKKRKALTGWLLKESY